MNRKKEEEKNKSMRRAPAGRGSSSSGGAPAVSFVAAGTAAGTVADIPHHDCPMVTPKAADRRVARLLARATNKDDTYRQAVILAVCATGTGC